MKHLLRVFALQATIVVMLPTFTFADEPRQSFSIISQRDTDKVIVSGDANSVLFSIHCPFGISHATIERTAEQWPSTITLRLHLKGLESFRIIHGNATLEASVSSRDDNMRFRWWMNQKEDELLDSDSEFWMDICMIGPDGKTSDTIPLIDGYFEMQLPKAIFEQNPKSVTIHWIDFYR